MVGFLMLAHMLVMLGVGTYFGVKAMNLALYGETAQGTVVDLAHGSKGSTSPIVEFTTARGHRVRFEGTVSSRPPEYRIGAKVPVRYAAGDPSFHAIESFSEMWILPAIFVPLGLSGVLGGGIAAVVGMRRKRARERVKTTGWHLPAVVVGAKPVHMKNSTHYEPEVEVTDPQTGVPVRCLADQQKAHPMIGGRAIVHVEPVLPHRHFVELG